jgi:HrpA-like RNA helicase
MERDNDKSVIEKKTYEFALRIIDLYRILISANEYVHSKQLLKAGTSVGANVEEAIAGQRRADFLSKMSIASRADQRLTEPIGAYLHGFTYAVYYIRSNALRGKLWRE